MGVDLGVESRRLTGEDQYPPNQENLRKNEIYGINIAQGWGRLFQNLKHNVSHSAESWYFLIVKAAKK
jgi:hypothetical protein